MCSKLLILLKVFIISKHANKNENVFVRKYNVENGS